MSTTPCNTITQDMTATCTCGNQTICNCQQNCEPCNTAQGCPINLDTECVFYNLSSPNPSELICLGISNGASLKYILETIDTKLCQISTDFSGINTPCLDSLGYTISSLKTFAEAVDYQLCYTTASMNIIKTNLELQMANITTMIAAINTPNITSCSQLPILPTDSLVTILQKYSDAFCDIYTNCCADNSPVLNPVNTNSISFIASGVKNHTFLANVNISPDFGNLVEIRSNGLYASLTVPNQLQDLLYNPLTNELTISEGNSVTLGSAPAPQTISVDCVAKTISISGGNTIDVSCLAGSPSPETPLVVVDSPTLNLSTSGTSGHILTGDVKISATPNNSIVANGDGIYAQDNKVAINVADTTSGYLSDKMIGVAGSLISVVTTPNLVTNKVEISATIDLAQVLTAINTNPLLLAQFCEMVTGCITSCYTFRITNIANHDQTIEYVDCNNNTVTVPLVSRAVIVVCAKSVTPLTDTTVEFLGNC